MTIWDTKIAAGEKFTDADVTPALEFAARDFLDSYGGTFDYVLDMKLRMTKYGFHKLSTGQVRGVLNCMLADRKKNIPDTRPVLNLKPIITFLDSAATKLKNPKVRLENFRVSRCGEQSKHNGAVNILSNVAPDFQSGESREWFGRIEVDGTLIRGKLLTKEMEAELVAFAVDPQGFAAAYGQRFAHCCFCSKEIITNESLAVGYGPDCANNYGLPWGETVEAVA